MKKRGINAELHEAIKEGRANVRRLHRERLKLAFWEWEHEHFEYYVPYLITTLICFIFAFFFVRVFIGLLPKR